MTATGINHNVLGTWHQSISEAMVYGKGEGPGRLTCLAGLACYAAAAVQNYMPLSNCFD